MSKQLIVEAWVKYRPEYTDAVKPSNDNLKSTTIIIIRKRILARFMEMNF